MSSASPPRSRSALPPEPATLRVACAGYISDGAGSDPKTKRSQSFADRNIFKQCPEPLDRGSLDPRLRHDEIVMLVLHRDEPQPVLARHALDRHAPVGAPLCHCNSDGIVRFGLRPISRRLGAVEQTIRQDAGAAAGIAVDHQTFRSGRCRRDRIFCRTALEALVALAIDD